jgi:hypothetical protein
VNPKTVRTLGQLSIILLVIAVLVMSPPLRLLFFVLAGLCALATALFSSGKWRVVGVLMIILTFAMAADEFPDASKHMQDYLDRGKAVKY